MGVYRCIVSGIGAGQFIVAYLPLFGDDGGHIPCVCEVDTVTRSNHPIKMSPDLNECRVYRLIWEEV
jgi:hypothetical protein